tara:strand:+ start:489 stop:662 length:174 start_codon:yes stop_codon:yes gene_type:complete
MKDFNFIYIVAGVVFGCIMYIATAQLTISIILGLGVAFGGNGGYIFKCNKESNQPKL